MGSKMTYAKWSDKNFDAYQRGECFSLPPHIQRLRRQAFDSLVERGFPKAQDPRSLNGKRKILANLRDHLVSSVTSKQDLRNLQATSFKGLDLNDLLVDFERAHKLSLFPKKTIQSILFLIRAGVTPSPRFISSSYTRYSHSLFEYVPLEKSFSSLNAAVRAGFQPGEDRVYAANLFSHGASNSSLKAFNRMGLRGKQLVDAARLEAAGFSPAELESKINEECQRSGYTKAEDIERMRDVVLSDLAQVLAEGYLSSYLNRKK